MTLNHTSDDGIRISMRELLSELFFYVGIVAVILGSWSLVWWLFIWWGSSAAR
jgi:hypothetical protein